MNATDRTRMARLYTCMARLPWPNRNRTIGPADLSAFFKNMEDLQQPFLYTIMAIARSDDPSQDPDGELDELEAALRKLGVHIP